MAVIYYSVIWYMSPYASRDGQMEFNMYRKCLTRDDLGNLSQTCASASGSSLGAMYASVPLVLQD